MLIVNKYHYLSRPCVNFPFIWRFITHLFSNQRFIIVFFITYCHSFTQYIHLTSSLHQPSTHHLNNHTRLVFLLSLHPLIGLFCILLHLMARFSGEKTEMKMRSIKVFTQLRLGGSGDVAI